MTSASIPSARSSAIASSYCFRTSAFLLDSLPSLSMTETPSRTLGWLRLAKVTKPSSPTAPTSSHAAL
eukprot:2251516-Prymnesium_polylepis.1